MNKQICDKCGYEYGHGLQRREARDGKVFYYEHVPDSSVCKRLQTTAIKQSLSLFAWGMRIKEAEIDAADKHITNDRLERIRPPQKGD